MKRTPLLLCLVSGLGATVLGHLYLNRLEAEVSGGPKVALLVASEDLPLGATLTEKALAVRDVPEAYVSERQVRASGAKRVIGVRLSTALRANDPVLWSDLGRGPGSARLLSGLIERGMRAVSIDARAADFDGLLRPGDRVDVLFTEGEATSTTTILQNVLVLSVGSDIAAVDDTSSRTSTVRGGTVTLAVNAEGAQAITQAKAHGRLTLSLRNADDVAVVDNLPETSRATLERLGSSGREQAARRSP